MTEENKKNIAKLVTLLKVEQTIKKRNLIAFGVFFILLICNFLGYISTILLFMISFPMMSLIMMFNSFIDENIKNNNQRIIILSLLLAFFSYQFYSLKIDNERNANKIYKLCIKNMGDNYICSEIYNVLIPEDSDIDK